MKRDFSPATWLNSVSGRFISGWERQRRAVLESLGWTVTKPHQPLVHDADKLGQMAMAAAGDCILELGSSSNGLTESEAEVRLKPIGPNEVAPERQATWYRQLFHAFNTPFNWLLVFLALLSFLTDDLKATIVLSVMVGLSSVLRFVQEFRSTKAAEKLQAMVSTTATVRRIEDLKERAKEYADAVGIAFNGRSIEYREIPLKLLVSGAVVRLSAGDMVPADVRLLSAKDLFISQAALTGEAFPVEKNAETPTREVRNALELPNICFMGSNVISGSAIARVVNTGGLTYFGGLSEDIVGHREPTEFDKGIHRVSWLLIRFMLVMAPVVLLVNGFAKHDWMEAFLFAIAIAVGLTPEMLPMIVTATLAKGAVKMSQRKVIVKRLNSIQNFGAMDVLCTDKTGTLTQDKIILERHVDVKGEESEEVLRHAFLNSYYQTGLKNLLDVAVLKHAEVADALKVPTHYRLVDEIPFDFARRRMSVVVNEREDHNELICKGAVEEIFAVSTRAKVDGQSVPLDAAL